MRIRRKRKDGTLTARAEEEERWDSYCEGLMASLTGFENHQKVFVATGHSGFVSRGATLSDSQADGREACGGRFQRAA